MKKLYVADAAAGGGDGTSWATAFNNLHDALAANAILGEIQGARPNSATAEVSIVQLPAAFSRTAELWRRNGAPRPVFPNSLGRYYS